MLFFRIEKLRDCARLLKFFQWIHPFSQKMLLQVNRLKFENLDPRSIDELIGWAQLEDFEGRGLREAGRGRGDVSAALLPDPDVLVDGFLVVREPGTVCGLPLVARVLAAYDSRLAWEPESADGAEVFAGAILGRISGPLAPLLAAERVVLNFVQLLSGIATATRRLSRHLDGTATRLLDTRKTPPGYRGLARYAFGCGGGYNHRFGLFERPMLKDNHLAGAGAVSGVALQEAVCRARSRCPDLPLEVEVDSLDQIEPVILGGADIVLLDNFSDAELAAAVACCRGRILTEASGGIDEARLPAIASIGPDFVSSGAPVHSARWLDIGLDWAGKKKE